MKRLVLLSIPALLAGVLLIAAGCHKEEKEANGESTVKKAVVTIKAAASAATQPATEGNVSGTVKFKEESDGVKVVADLSGFVPNSTHAWHVHVNGDMSAPNLSSAGGHYTPTGASTTGHQPWDLGNLTADDKGDCKTEFTAPGLTLSGPQSIVGKSVIIHIHPEDIQTDPTAAHAGARIAGGVIEAK